MEAKVAATGQFAAADIDLFNARFGTPTAATLAGYDAVLTFRDYNYADPAALGDALAAYVDGGGGVVEAALNFNIPLGGAWASGGYRALTVPGNASGTRLTLGAVAQPAHPVMAGVTAFDGGSGSFHNIGTLTANTQLVASWSNGRPLVAEKIGKAGKIVALNFYPPSSDARADFWVAATDGGKLLANALTYAASLPQLAQLNVLYAGGGSFNLLADPARQVMPWQVTGIQAVFDETVVGTPTLAGLPATTAGSPVVTNGAATYTWTFAAPIEQMAFPAAGVGGTVADATGNAFAAVNRPFSVLYGDVSGDGRVTADDLRAVQAAMGGAANPFANLNGIGGTDSADYGIARSRLGRRL